MRRSRSERGAGVAGTARAGLSTKSGALRRKGRTVRKPVPPPARQPHPTDDHRGSGVALGIGRLARIPEPAVSSPTAVNPGDRPNEDLCYYCCECEASMCLHSRQPCVLCAPVRAAFERDLREFPRINKRNLDAMARKIGAVDPGDRVFILEPLTDLDLPGSRIEDYDTPMKSVGHTLRYARPAL